MTDIRTSVADPASDCFVDEGFLAQNLLTDEETPLLSIEPSHSSNFRPFHYRMQMLHSATYTCILFGIAAFGMVTGFLDKSPILEFSSNFLAIASLSRLNSGRLARLAVILGSVKGGVLYALFDNAPLFIVSIDMCAKTRDEFADIAQLCMIAIRNDAPHTAQSCILGSVLANLLLVSHPTFPLRCFD